jgi:DNA-binding NarL/FixJ family response regulator
MDMQAMENMLITPAEHHLLHALGTGASNKHLAQQLGKSASTVRNQLSTLFKKINARNRLQAANWYREHGPHLAAAGRGLSTSVLLPELAGGSKMEAEIAR